MDILRFLATAAVAAILAAGTASAQPLSVPGEPALAPKAAPVARLRLPEAMPKAAAGPHYRLSPVSDAEVEPIRARNRSGGREKRLAIGLTRPVEGDAAMPPLANFAWVGVDGGFAARASLTSPGAASVRLAIDLKGVPEDVEMVFFGSDLPGKLEGPVRVGDIPDRTLPWWSPMTEGATQTVEFFVPASIDPRSVQPRLARASHIFTTASSGFVKRVSDIGDSGSCNVDIICSPLEGNASFRSIAASVAQMVFVDGNSVLLCTGTLLNDTDTSTQQPWFHSANHCFDNEQAPYKTRSQMQTVANTLSTLWFFESTGCPGTLNNYNRNYVQMSGGSTIYYQNVDNDVLLVKLANTPPAGAFYSGWDANSISAGTSVVTVHHPSGDLKKVSQGTVQRFSSILVGSSPSSFIEILWSSGTTEPGSSGAPLFSFTGSEYVFRGSLWGGTALCSVPAGTDNFSRFDVWYSVLQPFLAPAATPFADVSDLWWGGASEDGWGLNLTQHPSGIVFGVWYTYALDGRRTWFVLPAGTWTDSRTYTGTLYATSGPSAAGTFDPSLVTVTPVGSATLQFSDASNGTFSWSVNGQTGVKTIVRQPF